MLRKNYFIASFVILFVVVFGVLSLLHTLTKVPAIEKSLTPYIPMPTPHPLEVSGWYPDWDEKDALNSLQMAHIKTVLPFWYRLTTSSQFAEIKTDYKVQIMQTATIRGISVMPSIVNDFDGDRVHLFLNKQGDWSKFADLLILTAEKNGYSGFDLDWEEMQASDRDDFSDFVDFLARKLHQKNLRLAVTVHAQTGVGEVRDALKAQDLSTLSESADEIRVMAYDFHHSESQPGPITPLKQLQLVLDYTKKMVPTDKVIIGLPTYGYDWSKGKGDPLQYDDMLKRLAKNGISYTLDTKEDALFATYEATASGTHTVWFEDSKTLQAKVAMVQEAGFYKISLWRLGGEDPEIWSQLK